MNKCCGGLLEILIFMFKMVRELKYIGIVKSSTEIVVPLAGTWIEIVILC